jgi:hypothetical protein
MSRPKVLTSSIAHGRSLFDGGVGAGLLLPTNSDVNPGTLEIPIEREQAQAYSFSGSLTLTHDGVNYSCRVYAPSQQELAIVVPPNRFAAIQPHDVLRENNIGCDVRALDQPCSVVRPFFATSGNKLCSTTFTPTSGPTQGARYELTHSTTAGQLIIRVSPSGVPFGPGHWLKGNLVITEVPIDMPSDIARQKGCTV